MKTSLLQLALLVTATLSYSQISITKQNFDTHNDTTLSFTVLPVTPIDISDKGANAFWDFSEVRLLAPQVSTVLPYDASLPAAAHFPHATHCSKLYDVKAGGLLVPVNAYAYITADDTSYNFLGNYAYRSISIMQGMVLVKYSPAQRQLAFPFEYGDGFETQCGVALKKDGDREHLGTSSGTYAYEGYGQVKFPGDEAYTHCAKIHSLESSTFLVDTSFQGFPTTATVKVDIEQIGFIGETLQTFSWIKTTTHVSTELPFIGVIDSIRKDTSIVYSKPTSASEIQSLIVGVTDETFFSDFKVHPNPTVDLVQWNHTEEVSYVDVISASGHSYRDNEPTGHLEIKGSKGLYLVRFTLRNGARETFKIVKY